MLSSLRSNLIDKSTQTLSLAGAAQEKIPAEPSPARHAGDSQEESAAEIGVALPENWGQQQEGVDEEDSEEAEKLAELSNPTRRVLGPALPPQVLLDQAAEVAEAVSTCRRMIASFLSGVSVMIEAGRC